MKQDSLKEIQPLWHTDINNICLPDHIQYLEPDPDGSAILNDVYILKLISLLVCRNRESLLEKEIFHAGFRRDKTLGIIELWKSGIKLLPVSIMLSPESANHLIISNGRHRINLAFCCDQPTIPILVSLSQIDRIRFLL